VPFFLFESRVFTKPENPYFASRSADYFFFGFESTQLARQLQQERTQMEVR